MGWCKVNVTEHVQRTLGEGLTLQRALLMRPLAPRHSARAMIHSDCKEVVKSSQEGKEPGRATGVDMLKHSMPQMADQFKG